MRAATSMFVVAALGASASAGEPQGPTCPTSCHVDKARALLRKGDAAGARAELTTAYAIDPEPALLFALGQVELELKNYTAAITYYERFIATDPGEDQVALAQQAIGAARMGIAQPPPKPPKPTTRVERRWHVENTGLVVLGGAAIAVGGGLVYYAYREGSDTSGTLRDYDDRLDQARTLRLTGVGVAAAGTLAISLAIVRWRLDRTEIRLAPTTGGATVAVGHRW